LAAHTVDLKSDGIAGSADSCGAGAEFRGRGQRVRHGLEGLLAPERSTPAARCARRGFAYKP